jgi:citrate synthase
MINVDRLTTAEAAERLGVKPETLYAYVSRGLIERHRAPGGPSTFDARDIERLARTGRRSRTLPPIVFPSALTLIEDGVLRYRGRDAVALTAEHRFEEIAEWLWNGAWTTAPAWPIDLPLLDRVQEAQAPLGDHVLPIDRFRVIAAVVGARDRRDDIGGEDVLASARRLIRLLAHGLPRADRRDARRSEPARTIAEVLWTRLTRLPRTPQRVAVLDTVLGLLADHELASSTLAARLAAMVRAEVPEVVGAGLNVLGGLRHGGASLGIEALFREAGRSGVTAALAGRWGEGDRPGPSPDGFGHPLYPGGDPRATAILARLAGLDPPGDRLAVVERLLAATEARGLPAPNVDVALAAVAFCADMAPGSGEATFALARAAGWIAHAVEQYDQPTFMRARVDYVGDRPAP